MPLSVCGSRFNAAYYPEALSRRGLQLAIGVLRYLDSSKRSQTLASGVVPGTCHRFSRFTHGLRNGFRVTR